MAKGNHKYYQLNKKKKKNWCSRDQQIMAVFFFSFSDMNNW